MAFKIKDGIMIGATSIYNSSGQIIPTSAGSTALFTGLNADLLDGKHASEFAMGSDINWQTVTDNGAVTTNKLSISNTEPSTNPTTGALTVSGGLGVYEQLTTGEGVHVQGDAASTSPSTGALRVNGGAGIVGNLNVGGSVNIAGNLFVGGTSSIINSSQVTIKDTILWLGGTAGSTAGDMLDKGVIYSYWDNTSATSKLGFFGWDESDDKFIYLNNATETNGIVSGTPGTIKAGLFEGNSVNVISGGLLTVTGGILSSTSTGYKITTSTTKKATISSAVDTLIDAFAAGSFRSAKYIIQITQGSNHQVSEVLVLHNNLTTNMTEYAVLETNGSLGTLTSGLNGSNVELKLQMFSAASADILMYKTAMSISNQ